MAGFAAMAGEERVGQKQDEDRGVEADPPDPGCTCNHFWMVSHGSRRLSVLLQAGHECRDKFCGLLRFSLQNQMRAMNSRDFDLRLDFLNLSETGWTHQAVLLGLHKENGHGNFSEC